ncbi:hypothetical protein IKQ19_18300 [Candidatus Saccharibacteria bacterium]|nr:hypothetical protein [Candidatus Saccharibacteria bacterium]
MKKTLLLLIIAMLSGAAFAAPFGLKMGMTLKEIEKNCDGKAVPIEKDAYFIKPLKSHPSFSEYYVFVDKKRGLYKIRAITKPQKVNKYGTEIQTLFYNIKNRIAKTYGDPQIIDEIDQGSVFNKEEYWMYTLKDGARKLVAIWKGSSTSPDNLDGVYLSCEAESAYVAYLMLDYEFKNSNKVEDEQDSVF